MAFTFDTTRTTASTALGGQTSAEKTAMISAINVLGAAWATQAFSAGLPQPVFDAGENLIQKFAAFVGVELADETA